MCIRHIDGCRGFISSRHPSKRFVGSLQTRMVAVTVLVALGAAIIFSSVSMVSARSTLLAQVSSEAQDDFSHSSAKAQDTINASDISHGVDCQQLVNDLASNVQNSGPSNLIGIYIWSREISPNQIVPVSTDPEYSRLITPSIHNAVTRDGSTHVVYQPVNVRRGQGASIPGAVIGTVLNFEDVGDLEFFALYSYRDQQRSLTQVQLSLALVCVVLSVTVALALWMEIRSVINPVSHVAQAAQKLSSGDLNSRVEVNRNDELGLLQYSFNTMAASLSQKIDELENLSVSQRCFVSDVSHELRTPITTMRMASDLLESRKSGFDDSSSRTVELLSSQINRFQDLLNDLLEISRYDAGYAVPDCAEVDVRDSIGAAVDQVSTIAASKNVQLRKHMPRKQILAQVDTRRIIRLVRNLLANAIDFCEGRPIDIGLVCNDRAVVISVRDYGVGIAQDQIGHIFDRFWRGDPSRSRVTGGTGLGLSIAMADAKLHYGDIDVRSHLGEGTWFLAVLPVCCDTGPITWKNAPVSFVEGDEGLHIRGSLGYEDDCSEPDVRG